MQHRICWKSQFVQLCAEEFVNLCSKRAVDFNKLCKDYWGKFVQFLIALWLVQWIHEIPVQPSLSKTYHFVNILSNKVIHSIFHKRSSWCHNNVSLSQTTLTAGGQTWVWTINIASLINHRWINNEAILIVLTHEFARQAH